VFVDNIVLDMPVVQTDIIYGAFGGLALMGLQWSLDQGSYLEV